MTEDDPLVRSMIAQAITGLNYEGMAPDALHANLASLLDYNRAVVRASGLLTATEPGKAQPPSGDGAAPPDPAARRRDLAVLANPVRLGGPRGRQLPVRPGKGPGILG